MKLTGSALLLIVVVALGWVFWALKDDAPFHEGEVVAGTSTVVGVRPHGVLVHCEDAEGVVEDMVVPEDFGYFREHGLRDTLARRVERDRRQARAERAQRLAATQAKN